MNSFLLCSIIKTISLSGLNKCSEKVETDGVGVRIAQQKWVSNLEQRLNKCKVHYDTSHLVTRG